MSALSLGLQAGVAAESSPYVEFQDERLNRGRDLWLANCEGCHGYGVGGAPIPMETDAWAPRLEQGMAVLYRHALDGFFGPDHTLMPARGGNAALSDDEVRAAVDYVTALARYYIQQER